MEHELKLRPKYYNYILNGTKRIELRLNDEKRSLIKLGDIITFKKEPELVENFKCEVIGLLNYKSFQELFEDFPIETLANNSMTKEELLEALEEFYTKEKQRKYNVIGIKLKLL